MREVLEGTAARLAARHASEIEIAMLREIARRDGEFADDPVRLAAGNRLLHQTLYRHAHNRYLLKTLSGCRRRWCSRAAPRCRSPSGAFASRTEARGHHRRALGARDAERAGKR